MKREQLTEKILEIKRENGWTWKHITDEIGGLSPVLVVSTLGPDEARQAPCQDGGRPLWSVVGRGAHAQRSA
jgi:cyanate lyase